MLLMLFICKLSFINEINKGNCKLKSNQFKILQYLKEVFLYFFILLFLILFKILIKI